MLSSDDKKDLLAVIKLLIFSAVALALVVWLMGCSAGHVKGKMYTVPLKQLTAPQIDPNTMVTVVDVDATWVAVFRDWSIDPNGMSVKTSGAADNFFSGLFGFLTGWLVM